MAWVAPGCVTVAMKNRCRYITSVILLASLVFSFALAEEVPESTLTEVNAQFETWQMSILASVQSTPGFTLQAFTTDGCSGGMSDAWRFFAGSIPAFAKRYGDHPPWEACCVEHDRAYWRGETDDGYTKRLAADQQLQQCVSDFGKAHAKEYADKYDLDVAMVERNFTIAADLMYRAVRLGGKPCSFLPWRWGYGWPHCITDSSVFRE